jgi:hypothetical protein
MILKLNNKGSAIVSVLVITTFITVIGTVMLYISSQNYQEKQTDYQNKKSFYGAEEALDSLKAALVGDVEQAYITAYSETLQNYLRLGSYDARKAFYEKTYRDKLVEIWEKKKDEGEYPYLQAVKDYLKDFDDTDESEDKEKLSDRIYRVGDVGVVTIGDNTQKFVITGVRAKYTSGIYTTFLYTDICLEAPSYDSTVIESTIGQTAKRDVIDLTDCVIYMNWQRDDYEPSTSEVADDE